MVEPEIGSIPDEEEQPCAAERSSGEVAGTERATSVVCAAVRVRNPFRIETTERHSKSAIFISTSINVTQRRAARTWAAGPK